MLEFALDAETGSQAHLHAASLVHVVHPGTAAPASVPVAAAPLSVVAVPSDYTCQGNAPVR